MLILNVFSPKDSRVVKQGYPAFYNRKYYKQYIMDAIIRILHRLHKTQESCFGSPIGVSIEASKGIYDAKVLTTTINSPDSMDTYIITSSMTSDSAFQV